MKIIIDGEQNLSFRTTKVNGTVVIYYCKYRLLIMKIRDGFIGIVYKTGGKPLVKYKTDSEVEATFQCFNYVRNDNNGKRSSRS